MESRRSSTASSKERSSSKDGVRRSSTSKESVSRKKPKEPQDLHIPVGGLLNLIQIFEAEVVLKHFVAHGALLVLLCISCLWTYPVANVWEAQEGILSHFGIESSRQGLFDAISSPDDVWYWLQTVVQPTVQPPVLRPPILVREYNRLMGPVRLRQVRVVSTPCTVEDGDELPWLSGHSSAKNEEMEVDEGNKLESGHCWSSFSKEIQDKKLLNERPGRFNQGTQSSSEELKTDLSPIQGDVDEGLEYGSTAQIIDLAPDCIPAGNEMQSRVQACEDLGALRQNFWIDQGTRSLTVEMAFYNANADLSSLFHFQLDFSSAGMVNPSFTASSLRLRPYNLPKPLVYVRAACDFLYVAGVLFFFLAEVARFLRNRCRTGTRPAHAMQLLYLGLHVGLIISWVFFLVEDTSRFENASPEFVDISHIVNKFNLVLSIAAANIVIGFAMMLRFLKINEYQEAIWTALREATSRAFCLCMLLLLVVGGYALAGHWAFGSRLLGFHSFRSSCESLLRALTGTLDDFADIQQSELSIVATLYSFGWAFLACLVFVNMLIAVYVDAYCAAHVGVQLLNNWCEADECKEYDMMDSGFLSNCGLLQDRHSNIRQRQKVLSSTELKRAHESTKATLGRMNSRALRKILRGELQDARAKNQHLQPVLEYEDVVKLFNREDNAQLFLSNLAGYLHLNDLPEQDKLAEEFKLLENSYEEEDGPDGASLMPGKRAGLQAVQQVRKLIFFLVREVGNITDNVERALNPVGAGHTNLAAMIGLSGGIGPE